MRPIGILYLVQNLLKLLFCFQNAMSDFVSLYQFLAKRELLLLKYIILFQASHLD